jgi:uncharacterized protein YndB with AHSA1/START domain
MNTSTIDVTAEPGVPQVFINREVNAPREMVFRTFVEPDLVVQWLGPRRYKMTIDTWEMRDGGRYRYIHADDDGNAFAFRGVIHGTPSVDGIVQTFEFEAVPGHVALDTVYFDDLGNGRTLVRMISCYQSLADRDAMVGGGMAEGVEDGFLRMDELLERLKVAN